MKHLALGDWGRKDEYISKVMFASTPHNKHLATNGNFGRAIKWRWRTLTEATTREKWCLKEEYDIKYIHPTFFNYK